MNGLRPEYQLRERQLEQGAHFVARPVVAQRSGRGSDRCVQFGGGHGATMQNA